MWCKINKTVPHLLRNLNLHSRAAYRQLMALIALLFLTTACGFFQPYTLSLETPDGPPEYKAGWHAGCRTALSQHVFANAFVYSADYGSGIYQHDRMFQTGWSQAFFSCKMHVANFLNYRMMRDGPLE